MEPSATRIAVASLAAAAAFFVIPAIGVVIGWTQMPFLNADGTPDDAPVRGGAAFVLLSPLLFTLIASSAFGIGLLLRRLGALTPKVVSAIVLAASMGAGLLFASATSFGWSDAVITFLVFAGLGGLSLAIAASTWWKIAMRSNFSCSGRGIGGSAADARR